MEDHRSTEGYFILQCQVIFFYNIIGLGRISSHFRLSEAAYNCSYFKLPKAAQAARNASFPLFIVTRCDVRPPDIQNLTARPRVSLMMFPYFLGCVSCSPARGGFDFSHRTCHGRA